MNSKQKEKEVVRRRRRRLHGARGDRDEASARRGSRSLTHRTGRSVFAAALYSTRLGATLMPSPPSFSARSLYFVAICC